MFKGNVTWEGEARPGEMGVASQGRALGESSGSDGQSHSPQRPCPHVPG